MPSPRPQVSLKLYKFAANPYYDRLAADDVVARVRELDERARKDGLARLRPSEDRLIPIGMEIDGRGRVAKNGYGVLHLAWLAEQHPEWAEQIESEVAAIKTAIKEQHGVSLKYVIWAGMGGSAEDKAFYLSAGLLRRRARVFILDSTDPAKLKSILERIAQLEKKPIEEALRRCLVVGMAMGMTSYEPVVNLEKLDALYRKHGIENQANFIYMTLPGSILDEFGRKRGFRRVELQLDDGNSTAGRHSGPLTRGSLYPLALNGVDIASWLKATALSEKEIDAALQLAGFIESNAREGRDKVTWHLPTQWKGGAVWTKQDFEESLGKSEEIGVKIVINEKMRLANFYSPRSKEQDRCFVFVNVQGLRNTDASKAAALRRAGYQVAALDIRGEQPIPRYMQFVHYVVFALGCLRNMNFVTQPGVELYKDYARTINEEAEAAGGIEKTSTWRSAMRSDARLKWMGGLAVDFSLLLEAGLIEEADLASGNSNAPLVLAQILEKLRERGTVTYGELTYFGDTRYQPTGPQIMRTLEAGADSLFRSKFKMPVDVYEGPAMNHSFHEMIIGYGRGFSIVVLSEEQSSIPKLRYKSDYHRAQWLATQQALAERGRAVVGLTIKDLSDGSLDNLRAFFAEAARRVRRRLG